jgi:hypothetical protein
VQRNREGKGVGMLIDYFEFLPPLSGRDLDAACDRDRYSSFFEQLPVDLPEEVLQGQDPACSTVKSGVP